MEQRTNEQMDGLHGKNGGILKTNSIRQNLRISMRIGRTGSAICPECLSRRHSTRHIFQCAYKPHYHHCQSSKPFLPPSSCQILFLLPPRRNRRIEDVIGKNVTIGAVVYNL